MSKKIIHIELPAPPMGGKCWLLERKGTFVLERGAGVLRTIACTHAGAGSLEVLDGIPNDDGFFSDEEMREPKREPDEPEEEYVARMLKFGTRAGRPFYRASPVVMGSWMLDAGFNHGLTLRVSGGHEAACAIASVVWMPIKVRPK